MFIPSVAQDTSIFFSILFNVPYRLLSISPYIGHQQQSTFSPLSNRFFALMIKFSYRPRRRMGNQKKKRGKKKNWIERVHKFHIFIFQFLSPLTQSSALHTSALCSACLSMADTQVPPPPPENRIARTFIFRSPPHTPSIMNFC